MKIRKRTMLLATIALPVLLLSGCTAPQERAQAAIQSSPAETMQSGYAAKRFQESAPQSPTAVESAIELSGKYARLSEEAATLRQENQSITAKNQHFKEQVTTLEAQLQQTQKELSEANDFLIEMRVELNNWKTDVLGFRDEMREAEKAQLEALIKILTALGGEAGTARENEAGLATASAGEITSNQPQPQKTQNSGEPNE